jgi:tetratricopeptide (TPR) repeat protein
MRRSVAAAGFLLSLALSGCASRQPNYPGAPGGKETPSGKRATGELPGDETIKNPEVAYNLSLEFAGQNNIEAAHHYIALAMKLRTDAKYSYTQGLFYLTESKFQEAIANFELALQQGAGTQENNVAVLNAMGVCYKELGKDDEALAKFREVVNTPGLFSRFESYYNMGVIYMRQKKTLDAEAVFRKVVEENPRYYKGFNKLGVLSAARDDWGGATLYFKKALDLLSQDYGAMQADGAEVFCNYGEALFKEKLYPQARNALLQVLKISPEGPFGQRAKELLGQLGGG